MTRATRSALLTAAELAKLDVEVSILSRPARLAFEDHADLIRQLEPGRDGLILESGSGTSARRGTFLPQVWESFDDPVMFMATLKQKAGLPPNFWDATVKIHTYTVAKFKESELAG